MLDHVFLGVYKVLQAGGHERRCPLPFLIRVIRH